MTPDELKIVRRAYAKQITAAVRIVDEHVEAAFAEVPREDFLGSGPWPIFRMRKAYVPTPAADPVYLYTDDIVGIWPKTSAVRASTPEDVMSSNISCPSRERSPTPAKTEIPR